ncbi:polysaccharide deacetylase [Candidatus Saccharibacteria bacterium]|nr:polysaccharide deacetylase [Candidatus Saccharibacteria bacterium]
MELRHFKVRLRKISFIALISCFVILLVTMASILIASGRMDGDAKVIGKVDISKIPFDTQTEVNIEMDKPDVAISENFEHIMGTIYLTFDDGPGDYTGRLLDILKKHDVKATFFVTGRGDDSLILREHNEGHTVGLHTWSHVYEDVYRSVDSYFADLYKIQDRVKRITGVESKLIRFPGGSSNLVSAQYVRGLMSTLTREVEARGFSYFDWNVVSGDAGGTYTSDGVYNNVTSRLREGANVVLQHDIKDFSVDAVDRIIEYGKSHGFDFKPLDSNSPTMHHGVNN